MWISVGRNYNLTDFYAELYDGQIDLDQWQIQTTKRKLPDFNLGRTEDKARSVSRSLATQPKDGSEVLCDLARSGLEPTKYKQVSCFNVSTG